VKHGDLPPAEDVADDPWLSNVSADMTAFLLLERAGLEEDEPEGSDA
jgi:hypothetical protein